MSTDAARLQAARQRLAAQQAALVAALAGQAAVPAGFDEARVVAAATALRNKRTQGLLRNWPGLAEELSQDFLARAREFCATNPWPVRGGARADGRKFAEWLRARGLPLTSVREQIVRFDLRFRAVPGGYVPRRWPLVRLVREPGWLALAWWAPGLRERIYVISRTVSRERGT